jgi:hypothetical protein
VESQEIKAKMRERIGKIFANNKTNEWIAGVCYKNSNGSEV